MAFQFPSNGKDFPNLLEGIPSTATDRRVSIPFKREGLSELMKSRIFTITTISFNSLQTGRTFRTSGDTGDFLKTFVSIPFKREGLSERLQHY